MRIRFFKSIGHTLSKLQLFIPDALLIWSDPPVLPTRNRKKKIKKLRQLKQIIHKKQRKSLDLYKPKQQLPKGKCAS